LSTKAFFCRNLANWFYEETWHFTTLLSVFIEVVENLPFDADLLVHELLLEFPDKTSIENIASFLKTNQRVQRWFFHTTHIPAITRINLQQAPVCELVNTRLPVLDSVGDLMEWLELTIGQLDILLYAPVHAAAHGFCKGRNCQTHALNHVGKNYLFQFDLRHCFHSIHWQNVFQVFRQLGYSPAIARYLCALVTHRAYSNHKLLDRFDRDQRICLRQPHLPQGAPSSPALSNAVLFRLDKRLNGLAHSLRLTYSRYADDLALSGNVHRDWRFLEPLLGAICTEEGFSLNYRKTRLARPRQRQKVTGVVVNEKTNIDRRYYDNLKAILTNCVRGNLDSQNRHNHPDFRAHLRGRIQHVKSLNTRKGNKLEQIFNQIL